MIVLGRGVIKLMDSLFKNTSIAELDLRNNQGLGADAQDAILDALDFSHRWCVFTYDLATTVVLLPSCSLASSKRFVHKTSAAKTYSQISLLSAVNARY